MFDLRVNTGVDIIALPGISPPPDTSTCSESVDRLAQSFSNEWIGGLLRGVDINNITPFYDLVLDYLQEGPGPDPEPEPAYECPPTYPEPFEEWNFNGDDDRLCMVEANELLMIVKDQYPAYIENERELCGLYTDILEGLDARGVSLTDNEEFLRVAATYSSFQPPLEGPVELSEQVKQAFLTESGAGPIDSVEAMAEAMTVLFRDRADRGLEFEAIFDLLPPPEVFQCGEETLETAESLID